MVFKRVKQFILQCLVQAMLVLWGAQIAHALVGPSSEADEFSNSIVMVLKSVKGRASFCTGAFIKKDIILTAAHCVAEPAQMLILLRTKGASDQFLQIQNVMSHPQYNSKAIATRQVSIDIALLQITTTQAVNPISFNISANYQTSKNASLRIAGYGQRIEQDPKSDGQLRQSDLRVREPLSDILVWLESGTQKSSGACSGDSGGPILDPQNTEIVAITAWASGNKQSKCGSLTQGILLKPHLKWIRTMIDQLK